MVSRKEDKVDFEKIEKEVTSAVEADARYWRENDAKLRAVHQKVATYDEFRDIVLASHLKPLEKSDNIGQCFKQTWNNSASTTDGCTSSCDQKVQVQVSCQQLPTNAHEFSRLWKNALKTPADRYDLLLHVGSERLGRVFRSEISFGLLGEIITVLSGNYREEDSIELVAILQTLSTVNRFNLSLQFLDKIERAACEQLLQQLTASFAKHADQLSQQSMETVEHLMSVYTA